MADDLVSDDVWQDFHTVVNMSSRELQEWLVTDAAGESAERFPDQAGSDRTRHVLAILAKRRTDLTADDAALMREIIEQVGVLRGGQAEPEAGETAWRHALMSLGHDPLKPVD
ncbi:DUF3140 domain-containing protein [Georgenia sunbinii]|uniref:DUF3140 domain-containing protein n=1 Tax=Georgenia sunbinii TaxID=3117728 RepID=UPI002F26672E